MHIEESCLILETKGLILREKLFSKNISIVLEKKYGLGIKEQGCQIMH